MCLRREACCVVSRSGDREGSRGAEFACFFVRGVPSIGPDPETQVGKTSRGWGHEHDKSEDEDRNHLTFLL